MVVVDRMQIQQTPINLAHNAIEAMEGVSDRPKILTFTSRYNGVDLLIQVRDNGCGMSESIHEKWYQNVNKSGTGAETKVVSRIYC
jgi:two-component system sensor kinase FixL